MPKTSTLSHALIGAVAALLAGGLARTASAADAAKVLKEASAAIAAQQSFSFGATIEYRGKFQGSEEELDTSYAIAFDRANGLSVHVENADSEIYFYRSDAEYTRYIPAFHQYVTDTPEQSAEELVVASGFELIEPAMRAVATFVNGEPFSGAFAPEGLSYVGSEQQAGRACDRIRFSAAGYTYDLWIEEAPGRLVRRIEPDMAPLEEKFGAQYGTEFDFQVAAIIDTWEAGTDVREAIKFSAPDGVEKVAQFMPPRPVAEAEKMAGSPAPDFTLALLSGGEFTLSKEKGSTIILDFWATWCGPCRVAMPALHQVAKEFAEKGVKLYSIDQAEDPEQVKEFLAQMGLEDMPVALDAEMKVAELYKVDGIPQTVIIDAKGVIRVVHVGLWAMPTGEMAATPEEQEKQFHKALADSLREELSAIVAAP